MYFETSRDSSFVGFIDMGAIEGHDIGETVEYIYLQRFQNFPGSPAKSCLIGELAVVAGGKERVVMTC